MQRKRSDRPRNATDRPHSFPTGVLRMNDFFRGRILAGRCAAAAVLLFAATAAFAGTPGWVWQNPKPVGNYLTGVACIDSLNCTLVGIAGTIMSSEDAGHAWT